MSASTKAVSINPENLNTMKEESPVSIVFRRFRRHRLAMISAGVLALIFLASFFARQLAPFTAEELNMSNRFASPGAINPVNGKTHYFGTDNIGRDYFSRVLFAGRISLTVALLSVIISESIGMVVGAISGYYGGLFDSLVMRFVEFLLTIPTLPLLLILSQMLLQNPEMIPIPNVVLEVVGKIMLLRTTDVRQALVIVLVLAGLGWLGAAQLMRGMVMSLRDQAFVEASRSLGASNFRIIFVHMIPNSLAPIIVNASLGLAGYIILEAALSFLGFGIQDPIPTWGNMLSATQQFMLDRPYLPLIPGLPIFLCSLAFNYVGDGLRDALDPRLKL